MIAELRARKDAEHVAQFASSLAHALNNLLQVVNGNLEILAVRLEDERLRGYVDNALLAAQQLTEVARELNADASPGDGR